MSELEAQDHGRPPSLPTSGAPGTAVAEEPREESTSFWQVAGEAFRRKAKHIVAVCWIGFLLLMSIFVPFVANGHPYTIEMKKDGGWVRQWPLFENLTRLDVVLLVAFAGAVVYAFIFRGARKVGEREERMARRFWWLGVVFACTLAAVLAIVHLAIHPYLLKLPWPGAMRAVLVRHPTMCIVGTLWILATLVAATVILRGFRVTKLRNSLLILLAIFASTLAGVKLDPGINLSPYDYRAYESMLKQGTAQNAIFAPIHWGYAEQEPLMAGRTYEDPSRDHPLGTDGIGRDALSRLLWSMRVVMGIGFIAESIALTIGISVGAIMGFFARKVDLLGMRLVEVFESIPTFILILIFVAAYGRQIFMIMVILGLTGWTGIARFVRAEFLRLRNLDYVQAATALGLPVRRVVFRHMLPNGLTPVIVTATFGVAGAIMSESALSFLGVGVEPPTASWGSMLNEAGNPAETFRPYLAIGPGLMIFLTVLSYNIIGEGLRDSIDPRLNKVR